METIHHTTRGGQVVNALGKVVGNHVSVKTGQRTSMRHTQHRPAAMVRRQIGDGNLFRRDLNAEIGL
jgi:hypothetical protein